MDNDAKLRSFYISKMLYEQTDGDHYLTTAQICEQLKAEYGMETHRSTISNLSYLYILPYFVKQVWKMGASNPST